MATPLQNELVIVDGAEEYEVHVSVADADTPIGDLLAAALQRSVAGVLCDGRPYPAAAPLRQVPLVRGARLEPMDSPVLPAVATMLGLAGSGAAERFFLRPGVQHLTDRNGSIDVGVQVRGDQGGTASLYVDVDGAVQVDPGSAEVAVNGAPVSRMTALHIGDELAIGSSRYRMTVLPEQRHRGLVPFNRPPRAEFPASLPRLAAPAAPPEAQRPTRFGWGALLIPLLMGGVLAILWSPMMAIFALLSPAMLLANYYEDKRRAARSNADAAAAVSEALGDFKQRLEALYRAATTLAWRATPGPGSLLEQVGCGDSRLWQRRHDHPDFMTLGIGVGSVPWEPDITPGKDERAPAASEVLSQYRELTAVPITVDLGGGGVVGIAGHRRRQIEMARWLLVAAAAHHGPADLAIVIITDHLAEWDCLKWLPHLQRDGGSAQLAIASPGEAADELLAPLLDGGDGDLLTAMRDGPRGPATLILADVADVTSAAAAGLRRALAGEGAKRRCAIALGGRVDDLPSSCSDIVRVDEDGSATLERPSRAQVVDGITSWRLAARTARRTTRTIGSYADPDMRVAGAGLADVVHLFDLLGLEERTGDAIGRRWRAAGPIPRCAAPIGATADGPLWIDWVSDGPHGLLAGTTGAGKSELLRSLVASLAATVDPEHLNFVLIDYKGGSAFDSCAGLPHTVGMVTDLDGHLAQRALTCLEAELRFREERLRAAGAGDIDDYYAGGGAEPLPRLLVVIDEFAALAKELPEFMAALVDVAQRGRSLGVHLLLATQRPNGVINDNIRANTNLRLSLRVQDVVDSTDVVGTPEAAALARSRPGRGYVRRGPGDVVAFQSALVTGRSAARTDALALAPFSVTPTETAPEAATTDEDLAPTDLDDLVDMISQAASNAGMRPARSPWPDPLPEALDVADVTAESTSDEVFIGLADEPHRQSQRPFAWDCGSNLLIYGVQGSGTSTALTAAIAAVCRARSSEDLHGYVVDFDDQRLAHLEDLPHVGAVVGAGERDRQLRLLRYLQWEVAERRRLAASDPDALSARPRIVVGLDNFGGFRSAFDEPGDLAAKDSVTRLIADGPGVGVVFVITAKQPIDVPTSVASLVPAKLVMRLADRHEYAGLGVRVDTSPEIPGRAFESGTSLEIQVIRFGAVDVATIAAEVGLPPPDRAPWPLELLPTEVKIPDVIATAEVFDLEWRVPCAIGDDRLVPAGWALREGDHVLVTGPARSGKSTTLATIAAVIRSARPDVRITALTPRRSLLADCAEVDLVITATAQLHQALEAGPEGEPHAILIDDAEDLADDDGTLAALIAQRLPHRHVFAAGAADVLRSSYGHWTQGVRRSRLGLALKPNVVNDGDLWQVNLPRYGPTFFPPGRGYLIADGRVELAQVAWQ